MRRIALLMIAVTLVATGCSSRAKRPTATAPPVSPPPVSSDRLDVSGKWAGKWIGYGIVDIPRNEDATAELYQRGSHGYGRLVFDGADAAESVPISLRRGGLTGARVQFDISGSSLTMKHELGGQGFAIDFRVDGDRMVGRVRNTDTPVRIVLERVQPTVPRPPVAVAPRAAPAPPAPVPAAPEPPRAPEPQVALPTPTPAEQPAPTPAVRPAPADFVAIPEVKAVRFDFDRSLIRADDAKVLDANVEYLRNNADTLVLIEGHADERGTAEYNLALGERRARAARDYLVSQGIAADRISLVSFGEERPECTEHVEACWARNRRAEFLIKPK